MTSSLWLPNLQATQALGVTLGETLSPGTVILLTGDLGSGKTTLIQSLGQGLGITDVIVSPTFTLIQEYPEGRVPLYHFDLYRLTPPEVAELHPELYWQGTEIPLGIVAIEWPEQLSQWPSDYLQLRLSHRDNGRQLDWHHQGKGNIPPPLLSL
ncbi:tRNA (adenosine(37)-N6)-threonylcarbamoyltransferase complex ATPase subunit type 1 TsaE [Synechococcales cyanobacterium C]|uniref:tRNA threonylcarbamoyladenosine biosynthesis protein TsaE n=1 Tax=Petrachloros mirabilis ULC683 TaxID=2781853 RepID=A0A8K2A8F3_9CYAN|nr:tRNA (adenosine(37)-N6)-threonylcarbamoyltransferase complex ATPase subunit type 1 TsaE [Petrachloros mirabilis]NCJ06905.1 tRNA (adenosine(37)-N6)-threonylcarbamoyltransferase complex ATPase subunit type 1 TsaE [Petrachloros mirabilis ULC683]